MLLARHVLLTPIVWVGVHLLLLRAPPIVTLPAHKYVIPFLVLSSIFLFFLFSVSSSSFSVLFFFFSLFSSNVLVVVD